MSSAGQQIDDAYATETSTSTQLPDSKADSVVLCSMPTEILLLIASWLGPSDLMQLDLCFQEICEELTSAYRAWYGTSVSHEELGGAPNWKKLALELATEIGEHGDKLSEMERSPEHAIEQMLLQYYICKDDLLQEVARSSIMALRDDKGLNPRPFCTAVHVVQMPKALLKQTERCWQIVGFVLEDSVYSRRETGESKIQIQRTCGRDGTRQRVHPAFGEIACFVFGGKDSSERTRGICSCLPMQQHR